MKESYGEGLATHTDPESCGAAREGGVEALTGARAGRVFSRERTFLRGADAVRRSGRPHRRFDIARAAGPRAVKDPMHVRKHLAREPGDPVYAPRIYAARMPADWQRFLAGRLRGIHQTVRGWDALVRGRTLTTRVLRALSGWTERRTSNSQLPTSNSQFPTCCV